MEKKRHIIQTSILITALTLSSCVTINEKQSSSEEKVIVNLRLGTEHLRQGRMENARNYFQKALSEDPDSYITHLMLAEVYKRLGDFSQAEIYFHQAIENVPNNTSEYGVVHNNFGVYLCAKGLFEQAEQHFLNAAKHDMYTTPSAAYENAALCTPKQNTQQAENYFRKALALNSTQHRSLLGMAKLQFAKQNYLETRAYIQQFHAVTQATPESLKIDIELKQKLNIKPNSGKPN